MSDSGRPRHAPLAAETLCGAFQVVVAERPHQVAHRALGGGLEFTYAEFAARVRRLAEGLHSLGVRGGDTVAEMLTNRPEFNLVDVAALHVGATGFSIYNTLSPEQIQHLLRNSGARVVITERQFLRRVLEARTPDVAHVVLVDAAEHGLLTLDDLERRHVRGFDFEAAWRAVEPDDVVTLIYTSGTTGPSKAVQLTHAGRITERPSATGGRWCPSPICGRSRRRWPKCVRRRSGACRASGRSSRPGSRPPACATLRSFRRREKHWSGHGWDSTSARCA